MKAELNQVFTFNNRDAHFELTLMATPCFWTSSRNRLTSSWNAGMQIFRSTSTSS